ncbi:MAG: hypothetical protein WEB62_00160 [Bacteroidota bacterium]
MNTSLDYIGSMIIGGLVVLTVLTLNASITNSAFERSRDLISQESAVNLTKLLEHDLYKAGYRASGSPLVKAESLAVMFAADLNDTGVPDSVRYTVGTSEDLPQSGNPRDLPLYRVVNANSALNVAPGLVKFFFSYIDTGGNEMRYDSLRFSRHRDVVRLIKVQFTMEPSEPIDTLFIPVTVTKMFRPKNLGGW